jgi:hypothetical protein
VAFTRSGSDGEPAVRAAIIGGLVIEDVMQELSSLPDEWLSGLENE